jgi:hypothetical protein
MYLTNVCICDPIFVTEKVYHNGVVRHFVQHCRLGPLNFMHIRVTLHNSAQTCPTHAGKGECILHLYLLHTQM